MGFCLALSNGKFPRYCIAIVIHLCKCNIPVGQTNGIPYCYNLLSQHLALTIQTLEQGVKYVQS